MTAGQGPVSECGVSDPLLAPQGCIRLAVSPAPMSVAVIGSPSIVPEAVAGTLTSDPVVTTCHPGLVDDEWKEDQAGPPVGVNDRLKE